MRPPLTQLVRLVSSLIGVTLVVGMFVFFNFNREAIYDELIALYLIPQPERLTELYFNDNASLPSSVARNQEIHFTFVIHNLETTDYQYAYNVSVHVNDSTQQIVDSGTVLVKNAQYYVKHEQFKLVNVVGRQEVVVELLNKQQSIDFWMGNSARIYSPLGNTSIALESQIVETKEIIQ